MKAIIFEKYGHPEVLKMVDIKKPSPKGNEILIKIHATSVSTGDWRMRKPDPFLARLVNGLLRPRKIKILGFELAGDVEEAGEKVTNFKIGDKVFAFTGFGFGAYAEYICMAVDTKPNDGMIAHMPINMTYEQAAVIPGGGLTAFGFTRSADIQSEQKVLIYGASGNVGSYALQLAKHFGANVTGVCSGGNVEMVKSLGADNVINYKTQDFAANGRVYDVLFDAVGKLQASKAKKALKANGRFFSVMKSGALEQNDLERIKELVEAGEIIPYIDRTYTLDEIVEAHKYVEKGHKKANVVVKVE